MIELAIYLIPSILVFLILCFFFIFRQSQKANHQLNFQLQQLWQAQNTTQIQLNQRIQSQEQHLAESLYQRFDQLNLKIQSTLDKNSLQTHDSLTHLRERLSVIDAAQKKIADLSSQVITLQDILSNKQARGAFGEIQLQDLVTTILPPSSYEFQKTLGNGKRVDCFLKLPNPPGSICIDAKFPLESYRAMIGAKISQEKEMHAKTLKNDMLKHISAISEKYIIPGETAESALLFLPSESIYAELHSNFEDVILASYKARVWIVSPTTLMATLNTIRAVLKDASLREQSAVIQKEISFLMKDLGQLSQRLDKLDTHFHQAHEDITLLNQIINKINKRADIIEKIELGNINENMINSEKSKIAS